MTLYVGEIVEEYCIANCQNMLVSLPDSDYIFRFQALEPIDFRYKDGRQKVKVLEVFSGGGVQVDDEIYITSSNWSLNLMDINSKPLDTPSVELSYINEPKEAYEYLVFCSEKIDSANKQYDTYRIVDTAIMPIFCYSELENIIVEPLWGNYGTYVPYEQVQTNEFFSVSQAGLDAWLALKEEIIGIYS